MGRYILKDILKMIIAGAVIKRIGSTDKETGRRDLFGTNLCNYGHKGENGVRVDCGALQCPVANQCTQRGRYKKGS